MSLLFEVLCYFTLGVFGLIVVCLVAGLIDMLRMYAPGSEEEDN